ncbi:MAG: RNA-directed DNA polymerase [Candidatus Nealsonbacteria bacterium]|nr:RNA-directed DNA polymerase [Candidatus Nealsonbacteria bacterium]
MDSQPTSRQELYDRIRESSKDEVILEEMIRLGFWRDAEAVEGDPADEIRRKGELERQLKALSTERARLQNVEALKRALRKQRLEDSRSNRKETKERRLRERQERARAWQQRKTREIVYLGDGVSAGLAEHELQREKLQAAGLPVVATPDELAHAMGVSLGELRFLAFSRRTSTTTHYKRFFVPKKTGGQRLISAPMPRLKRSQEWILQNILEKVPLHDAAHGFRRGRSIVSNARPHVESDVVVNLDLKDFFPTVTYRRIKGMFRNLGYSEAIAVVLALICSEPDVDEVELDGRTYYVARQQRLLPQGAPTSPAITNIICRGLDGRLARTAEMLGFCYTRYADDITFSGSGDAAANVGRALRRIGYAVEKEGFEVHPDKTRVLRRGRRQEVTGLVVNDRLNVSRKLLRRFRATLFQIHRDGPAGKRWGNSNDVIASIEGFANFVAMVDPEKGAGFQRKVREIIKSHGRGGGRAYPQRSRWVPKTPPAEGLAMEEEPLTAETVQGRVSRVQKPREKKPWWKFW